jgi:hypothetical protein
LNFFSKGRLGRNGQVKVPYPTTTAEDDDEDDNFIY